MPVYINNTASIHPTSEPDYKEIITNANLRRRMSRIIKMGVACGLECIGTTPPQDIQAIITGTGLGCLADTEKFMNAIVDYEEQMLNPTAFIQSTFNTIGAQIALLLKIHAYNMTYVHRGLSFESALMDGMMRIAEGDTHVLVGGMDELTESSQTIQQRLGLLNSCTPGEGAQFFLLSSQKTDQTLAEITAIETFIQRHSAQEITDRIKSFLKRYGVSAEEVAYFVNGRNGNKEQDAIYATLEKHLFPQAQHRTFKEKCGEYQSASSYAVWATTNTLKKEKVGQYVFIYNHYQEINHSFILMKSV